MLESILLMISWLPKKASVLLDESLEYQIPSCVNLMEIPDDYRIITCLLRLSSKRKEFSWKLVLLISRMTFEKLFSQRLLMKPLMNFWGHTTWTLELVDKHAPEQVNTITLRPHEPWYNDWIHKKKSRSEKI